VIIAEATTSLKLLSVSEAVMELDLSGAPCLVFQHGSSGRVNIIYRRADGNVGWIDPAGRQIGQLGPRKGAPVPSAVLNNDRGKAATRELAPGLRWSRAPTSGRIGTCG